MPKSKAHKVIGTAAGAFSAAGYGYYYQHDRQNVWQFALGGALGGCATARLPDVLEPSKTLGPRHRGVFHGIALNGTVAASYCGSATKWLEILIDKANRCDNTNRHLEAFLCRLMAGFIIGAFTGLASHLLADLIIGSDGLPLLG